MTLYVIWYYENAEKCLRSGPFGYGKPVCEAEIVGLKKAPRGTGEEIDLTTPFLYILVSHVHSM